LTAQHRGIRFLFHFPATMISILQSSARATGVDDSDVQAAMTMAAAGGISPVLALIESGAVDERVFTRHLAEDLGWKWLETPQPEADDMAELKRMIPARFAVRHQVFPVGFERDEATHNTQPPRARLP
jgi:hypothetical protein